MPTLKAASWPLAIVVFFFPKKYEEYRDDLIKAGEAVTEALSDPFATARRLSLRLDEWEAAREVASAPPTFTRVGAVEVERDLIFLRAVSEIQDRRRMIRSLTLGLLPALLALIAAGGFLMKTDSRHLQPPAIVAPHVSSNGSRAAKVSARRRRAVVAQERSRQLRTRDAHILLFSALGCFLFLALGNYSESLQAGIRFGPGSWEAKGGEERFVWLRYQKDLTRQQIEPLRKCVVWMGLATFWLLYAAYVVSTGQWHPALP